MGKVEILKQYCKSCGFCVKNCPKQVLAVGEKTNAMGHKYVYPASPEACIGCKICTISCPDSAIEVYK